MVSARVRTLLLATATALVAGASACSGESPGAGVDASTDVGAPDAARDAAEPDAGPPWHDPRFDGYPLAYMMFGGEPTCDPRPGDGDFEVPVNWPNVGVVRSTADGTDIVTVNPDAVGFGDTVCRRREGVRILLDGAVIQDIPFPGGGFRLDEPALVTAVAAPELSAYCDGEVRDDRFQPMVYGRQDGGALREVPMFRLPSVPIVVCQRDFPVVAMQGSADVFDDGAVSHLTANLRFWTGIPTTATDPGMTLAYDAVVIASEVPVRVDLPTFASFPFSLDSSTARFSGSGLLLDVSLGADPSPVGPTHCASAWTASDTAMVFRFAGTRRGVPFRAEGVAAQCQGNWPLP